MKPVKLYKNKYHLTVIGEKMKNGVIRLDVVPTKFMTKKQKEQRKKYLLIAELSKIYEIGRGGDRKTEDFKDVKSKSLNEDVIKKTAKATGVNEKEI